MLNKYLKKCLKSIWKNVNHVFETIKQVHIAPTTCCVQDTGAVASLASPLQEEQRLIPTSPIFHSLYSLTVCKNGPAQLFYTLHREFSTGSLNARSSRRGSMVHSGHLRATTWTFYLCGFDSPWFSRNSYLSNNIMLHWWQSRRVMWHIYSNGLDITPLHKQ